jgi:hypothetical protein
MLPRRRDRKSSVAEASDGRDHERRVTRLPRCLVGWTDEKVRALFRVRSYLYFLESVDKPTLLVRNLLILSRAQANHAFGNLSTAEHGAAADGRLGV